MKAAPKITLPPIDQGQLAMVNVRGVWHMNYFKNGRPFRRTTGQSDKLKAMVERDRIRAGLVAGGATIQKARTVEEKILSKPDLYIYRQLPYRVQIGDKLVGQYATKREAETARDTYLKNNK